MEAAISINYSGFASERLKALNDDMATQLIPAMVFIAFLMVVGLAGNVVVCFVFFFRLRMSTQHVLIMSLAVFDLLSCSIAMPTEIVDMRYFLMFENEFACRLLRFINFFSAFASIMTLVVIAVDRYLKVCRPLGPRLSLRHTKMALAVVVFVAVAAALPAPILYGVRTTTITDSQLVLQAHDCSTSDSTKETIYPTAYSSVLFSAFVVTLGALTVMYAKILREMRIHNVYMKRNLVFRCNSGPRRRGSVSVITSSTDFGPSDAPDLPTGNWFRTFKNSFKGSQGSKKGVKDAFSTESETGRPAESLTTLATSGERAEVSAVRTSRVDLAGSVDRVNESLTNCETGLPLPETCASGGHLEEKNTKPEAAESSTLVAEARVLRISVAGNDDLVDAPSLNDDLVDAPSLSKERSTNSTAPETDGKVLEVSTDVSEGDFSARIRKQTFGTSLKKCSSTNRINDTDATPIFINDRNLLQSSLEPVCSRLAEYDYESGPADESCLVSWRGDGQADVRIILTCVWNNYVNSSDTDASEDNRLFLKPEDRANEINLNSSMNSITSSTPFVECENDMVLQIPVSSELTTNKGTDAGVPVASDSVSRPVIHNSSCRQIHAPYECDEYSDNDDMEFFDTLPYITALDSDLENSSTSILRVCATQGLSAVVKTGSISDANHLPGRESRPLGETSEWDGRSSESDGMRLESHGNTSKHNGETLKSNSCTRTSEPSERALVSTDERLSVLGPCPQSPTDMVPEQRQSAQFKPSSARHFWKNRNDPKAFHPPVMKRTFSASSQQQQTKSWTSKRTLSKKSSSSSSSSLKTQAAVKTNKATAVAIVVTVVFFMSFLPYLTIAVARIVHGDFDRSLRGTSLVFYNMFLRFYFMNAVSNPIIYGALNSSFRKQCMKLARKLYNFCRRHRKCIHLETDT